MNRKMVFYTTGHILILEAILFMLPLLCSVIYGEASSVIAFAISAGVALGTGLIISALSYTKNKLIYAKEGFAIVALAWLAVSAVGALPFVIGNFIPSYVDAFFETVSGFTTTGATILDDIEALSHGMLFWRSFTHWIGGMGVLVFLMAILPTDSGRSIHIMRAEVPGPIVGKIVPKIRETAKILYFIYIGLTALMAVFLLLGGMSLFESLTHTFGTAGTGGFGIKNDSIASYSPYIQWVITAFMLIFGINFNLFYLIIIGKFASAIKSRELWCFGAIVAISTCAIAMNVHTLFANTSEAIRHSAFQVASIISTTGFSSSDIIINLWPGFSKMIFLTLMFIGGCAGSTAGGLKVSRIMILCKTAKRDLNKMLHPRSVGVVKHEGRVVDSATVSNASVYLIVYFLIFFALLILISLEPFGFETAFSAVASCFNNVGPAFGAAASSYSGFSVLSKICLSFAMLFGRLEIFPLLLVFSPTTWKRK